MHENRKYQVFLSSTYEDLREERNAVIHALLELDCIPCGMELFPAADEDSWTLIRRVIDECDYYVVLIAGRYGSIGSEGKSFTRMEYEYAVSLGKPILGFLHSDPGSIRSDKTEVDAMGRAALDDFRSLVKSRQCKRWSSSTELSGIVSRSVTQIIRQHPATGWVRGDRATTFADLEELIRLRRRVEQLESELGRLRNQPPDGCEDLARDESPTCIRFRFKLETASGTAVGEYREKLRTTWNRLFAVLGPVFASRGTEKGLKDALCRMVQEEIANKSVSGGSHVVPESVAISDEDFHRIKVQFRALGLIEGCADSGRGDLYEWQLTTYGETALYKLLAVKLNDPIEASC
jgi:hypothetical protein